MPRFARSDEDYRALKQAGVAYLAGALRQELGERSRLGHSTVIPPFPYGLICLVKSLISRTAMPPQPQTPLAGSLAVPADVTPERLGLGEVFSAFFAR